MDRMPRWGIVAGGLALMVALLSLSVAHIGADAWLIHAAIVVGIGLAIGAALRDATRP